MLSDRIPLFHDGRSFRADWRIIAHAEHPRQGTSPLRLICQNVTLARSVQFSFRSLSQTSEACAEELSVERTCARLIGSRRARRRDRRATAR
ncbi:hypothetical protein SRHO_G00064490 [Serrasalmus rhombeus]